MSQPVYDPDKVLNLRVTPEMRDRLAALVGQVSAGAAKLSRHGLAVWCLERGLLEAERDPSAVLRAPEAIAGAPAAPSKPKPSTAPVKPSKERPEPGTVDIGALRDRLLRLREQLPERATRGAISRATGIGMSSLYRFETGERGLSAAAAESLDRELALNEKGQQP